MFSVKDVMVTPVVTASKDTPLTELISMLMKGSFIGIPVVNIKKKVIGIVTDMDILKAVEREVNLSSLKVFDVMNSSPVTIDVDTPVFDAIKLLTSNGASCLPVTRDDRLIGIVSRKDIVRSVLQETSEAEDISFMTDAAKSIFSAKTTRDVLMALIYKIGNYLDAERCSVISVDQKRNIAVVHSTYEDPQMKDLEIDLSKYPEILRAFSTGEPVMLRNALKDPLMKTVFQWPKGIDFKGIMVFPIVSKDEILGTLYFRTRSKKELSNKDLQISKMLAAMAADALKAIVTEKALLRQSRDFEKKVVIDDLTGLYNRRFFDIRLAEEYGMAIRHGTPLSCIMFDMDNFKYINDTFGHDSGDMVLKSFASALKKSVRMSDIVARYAGDEFLLLLPMSNAKSAIREAKRIKNVIDNLDYEPNIGKLSVSIGVACYPFPGIKGPRDLIKNADSAMYRSKSRGRNRISLYRAA